MLGLFNPANGTGKSYGRDTIKMDYPIVFGMMMVYLIVTVGIAAILSRRVRASDSFLVAARSLPWFLVMAVTVGDWIGGGTVIGVAQRGYTDGISAALYNAGMAIALLIFAATLATRYRRTIVPAVFMTASL